MIIGVMLRTMDEKQGIGIYTQNLMDHLLALDQKNDYVLFYRNPQLLGRYAHFSHVREKLVLAPNKLIWDQVKIPLAARREKVDLIFHTKFTVPLFTGRKTVMALHGSGWFVHPELYQKLDVAYIRLIMPLYCKKASALLANSALTANDFIRFTEVDPDKVRTVHLAASDCFRPITEPALRQRIKEKHNLPSRFILAFTKHEPRKNFGNLIEAFRICRQWVACNLVVVGSGWQKHRDEYRLDEIGLGQDVQFLGWVEQEELPAIYGMAEFLFFPSIFEEFGIPACEAMACGIPLVVSKTGAFPEIVGEAGVLVDPFNPEEMAAALYRLWTDRDFRDYMARQALERSNNFSWEKCARETLAVLERVGKINYTTEEEVSQMTGANV